MHTVQHASYEKGARAIKISMMLGDREKSVVLHCPAADVQKERVEIGGSALIN